jgi:V/A-type H+-transporting ATPase subunit I
MGISPMTKVLIAGHLSEFDRFSEALQSRALIHLIDLTAAAPSGFSRTPDRDGDPGWDQTAAKLQETHRRLAPWLPKSSLIDVLLSPPRSILRHEYDTLVQHTRPDPLIEACRQHDLERETLAAELEKRRADDAALSFWKPVTVPLDALGDHGAWTLVLGTVAAGGVLSLEQNGGLDVEDLGGDERRRIVLAAFHADDGDDSRSLLQSVGFSACPLAAGPESPALRYAENRQRIEILDRALADSEAALERLAGDSRRLMVLLRHYGTLSRRGRIFETWLTSPHAFLMAGWIKSDRINDLNGLIEDFDTLAVETLRPAPSERPPVALANRPIFTPFQLITRLYSHPSSGTLDPSPVLSIFFALFLGITLTDAGYGLVLVVLALIGLARFKGRRDILWIVFWGGVFTVMTGLLTGGIFGDLFRPDEPFVQTPGLSALRRSLMWFDPMKDPMTFFRLVLFLGVIHVATGLVLGLVSDVRQHRPVDALVDHGSWLMMLGALAAILFSTPACIAMGLYPGSSPPLNGALTAPAWGVAAVMAVIIVGFGARTETSLFFRFFIGGLKLLVLSGIFSYLGDILSYIRLMALGMVTAGIGMAVNTIAFFMRDIPVVGLVLTVLILLAGHLMNLAINLLGGFVHTLRLQYVEFFSKFFVGGGEPFAPLSESGQYIDIRD